MGYRLYGFPGSASFAVEALMADAGLPHEKVSVDISDGSTHGEEYLKLNPGGYVPTLVLEDGSIMYEASAILVYLADFHGLGDLIPDTDEPDRALLLRTLFYLTSTVQEAYKLFYYAHRFAGDESQVSSMQERAMELIAKRWQPIEEQLAGKGPYALGSRFSLADIYITMLASWYPGDDIEDFYGAFPAVKKCRDLVVARPGIKPVAEEHGA